MVKSGRKAVYGTPPPFLKASVTSRQVFGEQHGAVGEGGDVVDAGKQAGVFGRQRVGAGIGVVLEDAAGDHGAEPFAHVALLQAARSASSWLVAGTLRRGVEEAEVIADFQHQVEHAAVVDTRQGVSKGAQFLLIEIPPPLPVSRHGCRAARRALPGYRVSINGIAGPLTRQGRAGRPGRRACDGRCAGRLPARDNDAPPGARFGCGMSRMTSALSSDLHHYKTGIGTQANV